MGFGAEPAVPNVGRIMAMDERGIGLRATWRLNYGFINLSVWRGDTCVETFHLTPTNAAAFVNFLVQGLADVALVAPAAPVLRPVPDVADRPSLRREVRSRVATALRQAADRVSP